MSKLFNRKIQLEVGKIGEDSIIIDGARVSFDIVMNDSKETNTGDLVIYNLSDQTMGFFEREQASIFVKVGYEEGILNTLFIGDIVSYSHDYEGSNVITKVTLKDGFVPLANKRLSLSFAPNSNTRQILDKVVSDLNFAKNDLSGIPNYVYKQGFSFAGLATSALDLLAEKIKYEWTVANNVLIISEPNKAESDTVVQLLSPQTGLINRPIRLKESEPVLQTENKKSVNGWSFESLLIPSITPKSLIRVESSNVSGNFLVKACRFHGDTEAGQWFCKIEGIQA